MEENQRMETTDYNEVDEDETTLLHDASAIGDLEWTRYLLDKGYDVNARNANRKTPLMTSIESRHHSVAQLLLKAGADVSGSLHLAVKWSDSKGVKLLLDYGADIKELNKSGATPLFYLYFKEDFDEERERENIEILRILLHLGAPLMTLVSRGCFQVAFVLSQGSCEAVLLVLQSDIDFNAKDNFGDTSVLHYLAMNRDPGIAEVLKPYIKRFDINLVNEVNSNPLREAVARGNVNMVELLLEHGAKVNLLCRDYGSTVLWSAFDNENIGTPEQYEKCAELLLQHDIDPQATMRNSAGKVLTIVEFARMTEGFDNLKFVIAQMAIREKQNIMLTEPTRSKLYSDHESKVYLKKCRKLLKKKIAGTASVVKMLTAPDKKMAKYLRKKKIVMNMMRISHKHQLKSSYKYYFNTMEKRFTKVLSYETLKNKAAKIISQLLDYRINESNIITDKIIGYLNNQDLRQLYLIMHIEQSARF